MGRINDNKMKNIYLESEGIYRIELSNGFRDDGTRDRIIERVYGTEEEAIKRRDELKKIQAQMKEEGLKCENGGYTLTQTARIYLDDIKYCKRSISTVNGYKQLLNNWILPDLGDIKIRNITEQDLEKLYDKMKNSVNQTTGTFLSETYINHCHKLISSIFNYAKKKKWILSNPAEYVINPPKLKIKQREYYSYEEIIQVFELLKKYDIRFRTAITILFNSGLRRGELIGIKWKDISRKKMPIQKDNKIEFETTNIISINKEIMTITKSLMSDYEFFKKYEVLEVISDTLIAIKPKTEKSVRNITIVDECYNLLMEYKQYQIDNGYIPSENDYVFRTIDFHNIWQPNYLTKEWNSFVKNNNLKKITVHDIRHSHATYLLSIGIPPQDVARRLGHSEPSTTLKIYTHSNLNQDKKIASALSNNIYNSNKEKFEPNPITILAILINKTDITDKDELMKTIEIITKKEVNYNNYNELLIKCRELLLTHDKIKDIYNYLKNNDNEKNVLNCLINLLSFSIDY